MWSLNLEVKCLKTHEKSIKKNETKKVVKLQINFLMWFYCKMEQKSIPCLDQIIYGIVRASRPKEKKFYTTLFGERVKFFDLFFFFDFHRGGFKSLRKEKKKKGTQHKYHHHNS